MEISLERKYMTAFKAGKRLSRLCEASCDTVVPDSKPDIRRLLMSGARYKLRSKDAENGRISIIGELEVNTAYSPEGGDGIEALRTELPFECVIENEDVNAGAFVFADISIVALDTRILNPRKIMVVAKLLCTVTAYDVSEYEWYAKPSECGLKAFYKEKETEAYFIDSVCEKSFSIENYIELPDAAEDAAVLFASTRYTTDTAEAVGSKLIVKGRAESEITVLCEGKLIKYGKTDAFSQIFDLSERDVLPVYNTCIVPTGDFFEISNGAISYELSAVLQLVCRKKTSLTLLCDAYACDRELSCVKTGSRLCSSVSEEKLTESIRLEKSCEHDVSSIAALGITAGIPKKTEAGLSVPVYADVLYTSTDGELRGCRIHTSAENSADTDGEYTVSIQNAKASYNGRQIELSAELVILAVSEKYEELECVSGLSICEDKCEAEAASILLARYDGDLWKLAKRYRSDPEAIKAINGGEDLEAMTGKLILVPKI